MREDDETTAKELREKLTTEGHSLSLSSTLRCRRELGWIVRGSAYCQMIREANKAKRLEWARQFVHEAETGFLDVLYSDETSIQMESHRRFCCRKVGEPPKNKPRYIHMLYPCIYMYLYNVAKKKKSFHSLQRLQYSALGIFNTEQAGLQPLVYICWYRQEKRFRASAGIDKQ